jgi:hypothetical protein
MSSRYSCQDVMEKVTPHGVLPYAGEPVFEITRNRSAQRVLNRATALTLRISSLRAKAS